MTASLSQKLHLKSDQRLLLLNPLSAYPAHLASHRLSSCAKYV